MLNIEKLDRSLKLRMLSRLITTKHPFLEQILRKINLSEFFFPVSNQKMDYPINQAVKFLAEDRQAIIKPESTSATKIVSLIREIRLKDLLKPNGLASIPYFNLRIQGKTRIRDINLVELQSLTAHLINRNLKSVLESSVTLNVPRPNHDSGMMYWHRGLVHLSKLAARDFRQAREELQPICVYKIGAILSPGENANWTFKLGKLTSTRHKNLLLKIAHGDWYSKERLHRFGLTDHPYCDLCGQIETIKHKIFECPSKTRVWQSLARLEGTDLNQIAEPIEYALGMHKHDDPSHLAVHAELIQMLLTSERALEPDRALAIIKGKINKVDSKLRGKIQ